MFEKCYFLHENGFVDRDSDQSRAEIFSSRRHNQCNYVANFNNKTMAGMSSKSNIKRGCASLFLSQREKRCDCGGKTGKLVCKMDVSCDSYGRCLRGCSSKNNCAETHGKENNNR